MALECEGKHFLNFFPLDLLSSHNLTCGTVFAPKIPLITAKQRPTMTSSLTFSIMAAASPAISASNTGALYRFQNKKSSPRAAVVLPTCPNRLALGSQNTRSKHNTTCRGSNMSKNIYGVLQCTLTHSVLQGVPAF